MFLHDGLGAIESWKEIPERVCAAAGCAALLYDRWGYGGSEARERFDAGFMEAEVPVLHEILAAFDLERVDLVGHSDGATIALLFAGAYPERVRRLVSVAAHTFVEPRTTSSISELRERAATGQMPAWLSRLHGARAEHLLEAWSIGWLSEVHGRWDIRSKLSAVGCPVLAIQGEDDRFGTRQQLSAIGEGVEVAETWLMPGVAHTPYVEVPDEFVARVGRFLAAAG